MISIGPLEAPEAWRAPGARIRLSPLSLDHLDALTAAATADRATFGLAPIPRDRAEMERYVARALKDQADDRSVPFVVEQGGEVVGMYRLMSLEWWTWPDGPILVEGEPRTPPNAPDVAEIGHAWLVPRAQRTAVNSAACFLLMQHAFDVWRVHRLILKTDARNTRSRNAITRLGGKLEGVLRSHSPAADGVIRDCAMFSILPSEWPEVKARLARELCSGA
jgi:RimJ/RimL family protein N-acetyltransferase